MGFFFLKTNNLNKDILKNIEKTCNNWNLKKRKEKKTIKNKLNGNSNL